MVVVMIRDSHTSNQRKEKGQAFQRRVLNTIVDTLFPSFPYLNREDISSCPSCKHGEDIKMSDRLRAVAPVSIECKYTSKEYKLLTKHFDQTVDQTIKLGRTDNIMPLLTVKRSVRDTLGVMALTDILTLIKENALLKRQLQEHNNEHI